MLIRWGIRLLLRIGSFFSTSNPIHPNYHPPYTSHCQRKNGKADIGGWNRNQNETLTQNYARLGLTSRLNTATGGIEKRSLSLPTENKSSTKNKLAISNAIPKTIEPGEARVERDKEGRIVRVVHAGRRDNPLGDALNSDSEDDEGEGEDEEEEEEAFSGFDDTSKTQEKPGNQGQGNDIVRQLEAQAASAAPQKPRTQSEREREWIERLVEAHGNDYGAMWRDRKRNPMQQTERDLERRVGRWRAGGGSVAA